jgi:hypothetical protein
MIANTLAGRIYSCLELWKAWGAEAVLWLRIVAVFPHSSLPLLLALPIALKVARAGFNIVFYLKYLRLLAETHNEYSVLSNLPTYILKAILVLELVDNRYVVLLRVIFRFVSRRLKLRVRSLLVETPPAARNKLVGGSNWGTY